MSATEYFMLKEASLSNNCPECYANDGLLLTFNQRLINNPFYKANGTEIVTEMHCGNCNTQIFPVRWTDDIERVVEYQQRALQKRPKSLRLKPLAWILILLDMLLLIMIILFAMGIISFN